MRSENNHASDDVILIKRYNNRKLYDTSRKRYVNHKKIVEMIREGVEVRIIDNNSGKDITTEVLSKAMVTEADRKRLDLSKGLLIEILKNPSELQKRLHDLFSDSLHDLKNITARRREEVVELLRDWTGNTQRFLEELQQDIDNKVASTISRYFKSSRLKQLEDRLSELEKRLKELEKKVDN